MSGWLTDAFRIAGRSAQSRVVFGPHETNLCDGRSIGDRLVAYYERRARGGAGIIITESASVHESDHPYERAPLATDCAKGWAATAAAAHPHGTVVFAGLTHNGLQGSSAYTQQPVWGPSAVPDPVTRELPMLMGQSEIDSVVHGFRRATCLAVDSGLDGIEIDIGPRSLLRQFHSPLTNLRDDAYGEDRTLLTRQVIAAARAELGPGRVLSIRLSCDELAPWAGITPTMAVSDVRSLAATIDLLVVVRGGLFSTSDYRPDAHAEPGFNAALCRRIRTAVADSIPVVLQGSMIDAESAQSALDEGIADAVEMTRAQIADPDFVDKVRTGRRPRPCLLCNQACQVRDSRNPIVSCVVNPSAGYESVDAPEDRVPSSSGDALVVGAGVAGLEAARLLAAGGYRVTVKERSNRVGGMLRHTAVGAGRARLGALPDWLAAECRRLGVHVQTGTAVDATELAVQRDSGMVVILATGSVAAGLDIPTDSSVPVVDAAEVLCDAPIPAGPAVVYDPVGGPAGVAVAEWLRGHGHDVVIATPDRLVGKQLAATGDLAAASGRLQRAGVTRLLGVRLRALSDGCAELEDRFTGAHTAVPCALLVDCTHRLPDTELRASAEDVVRIGDCLAPRTALEAVREGRFAALQALSK